MADQQNPLVHVSKIQDFVDLNDYLKDPDFQLALDKALNYMAAPKELPDPKKVAVVITQLSSYALQFRIKYNYYMTFAKGTKDASYKKNVYRGMYDGLDNLVDSLKYLARPM